MKLYRFFGLVIIFGLIQIGISSAQDSMSSIKHTAQIKPISVNTENISSYYRIKDYNGSISELQQRLNLSFENEPLKNVLKEIAMQGNLGLGFSNEWEDMNEQITLKLENNTIAESLNLVLADTEFEAGITRRGEIILLKKAIPEQKEQAVMLQDEGRYGIIIGDVKDADTGETLAGANIIIKGTTTGVATDVDGRFLFRRVPAGHNILEIRYLGYITKEVEINLSGNERLELNFKLVSDMIEGDEIYVVGRQRGQARALTRQRQSQNIRSIISSEQIDRFADTSVEEALFRVSGVQESGKINIRGAGRSMHNVTIDGQRMGSTGEGNREVDLATISIDMVEELDVIKVITPDMSADAVSGVINISTRLPVGGDRQLDARVGGGMNTRFSSLDGLNTRNSLTYGNSSDKFAYAINLSYRRDGNSREEVDFDFNARNFGGGPVDVLDRLTPNLQNEHRQVYGVSMQFTYQPSNRTTYHVQGMFNEDSRERIRHRSRYDTRNDWIDQFTTGRDGEDGRFDLINRIQDRTTQQYTIRSGARHLFDNFDMQYNLGIGYGRYTQVQDEIYFRSDGFNYAVNMENRRRPIFTIINTEFPEQRQFRFRNIIMDWRNHINYEITGGIDFDVPFKIGSFKFGASSILTHKDGNRNESRYDFQRRLTMYDFDMIHDGEWDVVGQYNLPWLLNAHGARSFFYGSRSQFMVDDDRHHERSEITNYLANENIHAVYGMTTLNFGRFSFLGGLRIEHTQTRYDGILAEFDDRGRFIESRPTSQGNDYSYFFPNAQLLIGLGQMTNIRFAFSRAIARPDFDELAPFQLLNESNEEIRRGNPDLQPMLANNLDALFEHYFMDIGQFSIGVFYKEMTDFVFEQRHILEEGEYAGWEERTYLNGEEATLFGLEVAWQQNLSFLPGFLKNFGTYANYSYTNSVADVGREENVTLPEQRPHVANFALEYNQRPVSAQISYHWSASGIHSYGNLGFAPRVNSSRQVYIDRYRGGRSDLSLSIRYRLTSNIRVWADASNLLSNTIDQYLVSTDYPYQISYRARLISLGLRYRL